MPKILVIDDNIDNLITVNAVLKSLMPNSKISTSISGKEGIEKIRRDEPDVILLDIQMPEMDGNEATKRIRDRWPKDHQPYIIAMTAHALEGDREKYIARGMDDYVSKPIKVDALIAALEKAKPVERKSA